MTPRVTVLVNTYNHERFIERCLQGVVEQDFPAGEMEAIVVDDGSTDRTPEIAHKFEPRVRLIRKANGGQVSAFNAGVAEARGEVIAFLDGDDWWASNKLTAVVRRLEGNSGVAAVGHGYYEVNENDSIRASWIPDPGSRLSLETPELALRSTNLRTFLGTSRLAIRKSVVDRALPVPPNLPFFDNFIFSQAVAMGGAVLLSEPLCYYRVHRGSLYAADEPTERQLQTRYQLLCGLLESLPARLRNLGISDDAISAFLDFDRTDAKRLKLLVRGGWPWETYRIEKRSFRQTYREADFGYRLFKHVALLSTLVMPPRSYYRLCRWYSVHNIRRFRERLGRAKLAAPVISPRPVGEVPDSCGRPRPSVHP
jgi:glycosyltransferase involved in cell wall biosynthesis